MTKSATVTVGAPTRPGEFVGVGYHAFFPVHHEHTSSAQESAIHERWRDLAPSFVRVTHNWKWDVEFAARQEVAYDCPRAHHFSLTFAAEAEIPSLWECPRCGAESLRSDGQRPEVKEEKPARTHWDMLRERRSIAELEELLNERLDLLRSGMLRPNGSIAAPAQPSKKSA